MEYYIVMFIYMNTNYYLIWVSDEKDKFLNENGRIFFWTDLNEINEFANRNNIKFAQSDEIIYNLDKYWKWCLSDSQSIDCDEILNMWNIINDVYYSIKKEFIGNSSEYNVVYDKLFYGNNLPVINHTGEKYKPIFSNNEVKNVKNILKNGLCEIIQVFMTGETM